MGMHTEEAQMFKDIRKLPLTAVLAIVAIVVWVGTFGIARPLCQATLQLSTAAARQAGQAVGWANGSFNGVVHGIAEGREAGKQEGLSAVDTVVQVREATKEMGSLEVLTASASLNSWHEVGETYKAVYEAMCEVIFTVDLQQAEVEMTPDGELLIWLPAPTTKMVLDEEKTQKVWDDQRPILNGSTADGFEAAKNSMSQILDKDNVANYDSLEQQARSSARQQVKALAEGVSMSGRIVTVKFVDEE